MNTVPDNFNALITEACRYPTGTPQRQRRLTQLIRLVSKRLWQENVPYYPDALQDTWYFFCRNICACDTDAKNPYDSSKGSVITWLNTYLKYRLRDGRIAVQKQRATTISQSSTTVDMDGKPMDPIDRLPAPPETPPLEDSVKTWLINDPDNILATTHLKQHPHITCQLLLLRRLPPETSWQELAAELGVSISTLSSFYQRKCYPLLREFGHSQGYF